MHLEQVKTENTWRKPLRGMGDNMHPFILHYPTFVVVEFLVWHEQINGSGTSIRETTVIFTVGDSSSAPSSSFFGPHRKGALWLGCMLLTDSGH